ncbi:Protein CBG27358 [Caenorhabditis briggsae]|uniref:Protein CBG27358 n=1 Tax=Caenorhabditis briggsae TaxID=6238 RepID=B6IGF8_CAEBR|nr:Protein CBG27358 [Caenorhabditis briggsae]CAR98988.1 Protein CBG27358 [Caenorhabditis briggsae]
MSSFLAYPVENAHSGSKIEAGQSNSQILDPMDFSDTNFSPREQYLIDTALAEREKCEGLEKKVEEQQEYIKFLQEKAEELKKKEMKTKNEMVKYRDQGNVARNIAKEAKKRVFELEKEAEDRFNQQNGKFMVFDHIGRMDAYLERINEKIKKVQLENEYVMNVIRVMSSCNEQTEQWNLYQGRMIEDLQEELQKKEEELKKATLRITEIQNQKYNAEITHITLEKQKVAHERCQSEQKLKQLEMKIKNAKKIAKKEMKKNKKAQIRNAKLDEQLELRDLEIQKLQDDMIQRLNNTNEILNQQNEIQQEMANDCESNFYFIIKIVFLIPIIAFFVMDSKKWDFASWARSFFKLE